MPSGSSRSSASGRCPYSSRAPALDRGVRTPLSSVRWVRVSDVPSGCASGRRSCGAAGIEGSVSRGAESSGRGEPGYDASGRVGRFPDPEARSWRAEEERAAEADGYDPDGGSASASGRAAGLRRRPLEREGASASWVRGDESPISGSAISAAENRWSAAGGRGFRLAARAAAGGFFEERGALLMLARPLFHSPHSPPSWVVRPRYAHASPCRPARILTRLAHSIT